MKSLFVIFGLIASVCAGGLLHAPLHHTTTVQDHIITQNVPTIVNAPAVINTVVPAGVSRYSWNVPQSRFSRTEWEKPGDTIIEQRVHRYPVEVEPARTSFIQPPPVTHSYSYTRPAIVAQPALAVAAPIAKTFLAPTYAHSALNYGLAPAHLGLAPGLGYAAAPALGYAAAPGLYGAPAW